MRQFFILAFSTAILFISSCTKFRCSCTDGYVVDVKYSSKMVAATSCEGVESDRQIIKKTTKCELD